MTQEKYVKKDACNVFKRVQAYMGGMYFTHFIITTWITILLKFFEIC